MLGRTLLALRIFHRHLPEDLQPGPKVQGIRLKHLPPGEEGLETILLLLRGHRLFWGRVAVLKQFPLRVRQVA